MNFGYAKLDPMSKITPLTSTYIRDENLSRQILDSYYIQSQLETVVLNFLIAVFASPGVFPYFQIRFV